MGSSSGHDAVPGCQPFCNKEPVVPVNGFVTVPTGPGMGVEIDPVKISSEREFAVD